MTLSAGASRGVDFAHIAAAPAAAPERGLSSERTEIPRFAPRRRSDAASFAPEDALPGRAAPSSSGMALRETLNLVASPLLAALGELEPESRARAHVETSLRACRRLLQELDRFERAALGRTASTSIDLRKFRVTGYQPRRQPSAPDSEFRVLVVDDAVEQRAFLRAVLSPYAQVTEVSSSEEALRALANQPFEVVVTDLMMPGMRGDELCLAIRAEPRLQHVRLVVLTALASRSLRDELLSEVVDDYLQKPLDPNELTARISRLGREARAARELFESARTDALTGLPNRKSLIESLEQAAVSSMAGAPMAVALLDVDHFKGVNDAHGHAVGDEVLCELGLRLRRTLGSRGMVGRFGGEEFLVVIDDGEDVEAVSHAICDAMRHQPFDTSAGALWITASVGAARFGEHDASWATVVERADERLYAAKRAGRNRAVICGDAAKPPGPS